MYTLRVFTCFCSTIVFPKQSDTKYAQSVHNSLKRFPHELESFFLSASNCPCTIECTKISHATKGGCQSEMQAFLLHIASCPRPQEKFWNFYIFRDNKNIHLPNKASTSTVKNTIGIVYVVAQKRKRILTELSYNFCTSMSAGMCIGVV